MQRRFGWQTDPADAHPIGDLVQASFSSVMAFSEPGDAVLLQLPSYPPFMAAINDTGRRLIANPMRDNGTRWVLDLAAYEAAPDPRARVLIFCHPQNPTGRAYSRAELEEVAAFAIRHDLIVVSDEIHADIVYPGNTHIPLASLSPGDRRAHHHHHLGDQELQHSRAALRGDAFRRAGAEATVLRAHSARGCWARRASPASMPRSRRGTTASRGSTRSWRSCRRTATGWRRPSAPNCRA